MNRVSFFISALIAVLVTAASQNAHADPVRTLLGHTSYGDFFLETTRYETNGLNKRSEVIITPSGKSIPAQPYGLACDGEFAGNCDRPTIVETILDTWLVTQRQVYEYSRKDDNFVLRMNFRQYVTPDVSLREKAIVAFVCMDSQPMLGSLLIFNGGRWSMTDPPPDESAHNLGIPISIERGGNQLLVRTKNGSITYDLKKMTWDPAVIRIK